MRDKIPPNLLSHTSEEVETDYHVGYKRPPKSTRFKKGKSGNPLGRPKNAKGFNATVERVMEELVFMKTANGHIQMAMYEAIFRANALAGAKGNTKAASLCFDRYTQIKQKKEEEGIIFGGVRVKFIEPDGSESEGTL